MNNSQILPSMSYWALPGFKVRISQIEDRKAQIPVIINAACDFFSIDTEELISGCRKRELVVARHMVMMYLLEKHNYTLKLVGSYFNRDHTSVIHARTTMRNLFKTDADLKERYSNLSTHLTIEGFKFHRNT